MDEIDVGLVAEMLPQSSMVVSYDTLHDVKHPCHVGAGEEEEEKRKKKTEGQTGPRVTAAISQQSHVMGNGFTSAIPRRAHLNFTPEFLSNLSPDH